MPLSKPNALAGLTDASDAARQLLPKLYRWLPGGALYGILSTLPDEIVKSAARNALGLNSRDALEPPMDYLSNPSAYFELSKPPLPNLELLPMPYRRLRNET